MNLGTRSCHHSVDLVVMRTALPQLTELFINGQWVAPVRQQYFDVLNPTTEQVIQRVAQATTEDVDAAVQAASAAFASWSQTSGHERAQFLRRMADAVEQKIKELAHLETLDAGKTIAESEWDMGDVVSCFRYYAKAAEKLDTRQNERVELEAKHCEGFLRYEPVGVVGAVIPWNYPLLMALWKIAPALAAGCTMVLKPSELTPLTALQLAQISVDVKLPPGVLNVITGFGPEAGAPLASHPDVHKVAFTGSVPTGRKIMSAAAADIKKISLELGGKSPAIVFDNHNLDRTVEWVMFGCFGNNGQVCSATSRLLVHEGIANEFLERLVAKTKKIKVGNPLEADVRTGPLVSKAQQTKVLGYIQSALDEGATIGGQAMPDSLNQHAAGYFVHPTILTNVQQHMRVWREEIFGPVLSVMTFKTEEEAIRMANDTEFGLAGAVFSANSEQLDRVARALRVGVVWKNCSQPNFVELPWGGMKKSGIGRELGPFGLDAYLEPKQICSYIADEPLGFYLQS